MVKKISKNSSMQPSGNAATIPCNTGCRQTSRVAIKHFAIAVLPMAAALAGCGGSDDNSSASTTPVAATATAVKPLMSCDSLNGKQFADVSVTSAKTVAASATLPAYCEVLATENGTQHDIKVLLPDSWFERYYQEGGGGFDGSIPNLTPAVVTGPNAGTAALKAGSIVLGNNGGHRDPTGAILLNNPLVVERYAHTAIIIARNFGDALAQAYYGKIPHYSYYEGCSNGGRGALNAASKYGANFDAVIAGAPTRNLPGQIAQWTRAAALKLPSATKLKAVAQAAIAKCDTLDQASDGIISNWQACNFDPTTDVPASVGLSADEANAVKALMTDLKLSDSTTIYSGYGFGDMSAWGPAYAGLGVGHMRNIVLNDTTWSASSFDVNADYSKIFNIIQNQYHFDAETNGLAQFLQSGKKIVVWQGSDDALLSHKDTIRTWQEVTAAAGTAASQNSKLYIAAGVNHCGGGPGADTFDLFTPTMNWVEKGVTPQAITARKTDSTGTNTSFTRPLCEYPTFPKYKGSGDVNDAANYSCAQS
jgi:feruloyl esterase